jgi:protein-S-isoprenylcysteine O-methyltransferase Ste14
MTKAPWWKGTRGEWYVVIQVVIFGVILIAPRTLKGLPAWSLPFGLLASIFGGLLMLLGGLLALAGVRQLGANLTAVPYPKEEATLVESGPYSLVRHPIYSGLIIGAFGWAFLINGWLTLVYAAILLVFFDIKSRREEKWLGEKYKGYAAYQKRVHKLIPFIY